MLEILREAPKPQQVGTPESIERRRRVADALLNIGTDFSPVGHWTQGLARVANAMAGAYGEYKLNQEEAAGKQSGQDAWAAIAGALGGAGAGSPASSVAPTSSSAAAPTSGSTAQAVNTTLSPSQKALLDTIAGTESPGYNVIYGGKRFDSYADHPRVAVPIGSGPNTGKTSSAAGRYQFLGSTWDAQAKKLGLTDFSPANQDLAAWDLAATTYAAKTGRDLNADLNDPNARGGIGKALSGVWTSLPGGIEAGTNQNRFAQAYANNLGHYGNTAVASAPDATPLVQRGPVTAQVGDLVQRGQVQGEMTPAVQVASANPNFVPQMPTVGPQASPFTPASQLKQGNFQPGSLTPAQAKQYADNGYNVPNESINWGQDAAPAAPSAGNPQIAPAPQAGRAVVAQALQNAPAQAAAPGAPAPVAQAAPSPIPAAAGSARGGPSVQQLIQASQNPWLSEGQRSVVGALLNQALKPQEYGFQSLPDGTILRTDPRTGTVQPIYQGQQSQMNVNGRIWDPNTKSVIADLSDAPTATVNGRLVNTRNGTVVYDAPPNQEYRELNGRAIAFDPRGGGARDVTPEGIPSGYRPATDQERAAYGVAPGTALYFGPDNKPATLGTPQTIINNSGEKAFDTELGKTAGTLFGKMLEGGPQAQQDMANIATLRDALSKTGSLAGLQGFAQDWGLNIGPNADAVQTAKAMIAKLVPAQRVPGSGNTSDRDLAMFQSALPRLTGTVEGNKVILDTMQSMAEYKQAQADIATKLATGGFKSPQDPTGLNGAMAALQALPNPYQAFKAATGQDRPQEAPKQGGVVSAAPAAPQAATPPLNGAKQAPDGNWYVPDPARPGKYLMVK